MKTLLKNGLVIDGGGKAGYKADILIEKDKITRIGSIIPDEETHVIDITGLAAAPGFIDTHSHSDLMVLVKPELLPKVMQGITTEILGQDGVSMAPLPENYISSWRKNLAGFDGDSNEIDWHYKNTAGYLDGISKTVPGVNVGYLVPHGNIRMEAMGMDARQASDADIDKMKQITRREMESGALGVSTGLIYIPCAFAKTRELAEICKTAAGYKGIFAVHQRSEADDITNSMREVLEIGAWSKIHVHFSHFKICGRKNWGKAAQMLRILENAESKGMDISFDMYPYIAGSTTLSVLLPPWVFDGGADKALERLCDRRERQKMIADIEHGIPGWDNFLDFAGFDKIFITSVHGDKNKDAVGLSLTNIAKLRGKNPYDALFDILYEDELMDSMVDFYGSEDNMELFLKRPEANICTDGLLGEKPHPRVYGAFPRVLGLYAREKKAVSLENAVYKMTKKPASVFHLRKRGELKEGFYADICVFDPGTIADKGTFTDPVQYPDGIKHVLVNGRFAVKNGKPTMFRNGKVLYGNSI